MRDINKYSQTNTFLRLAPYFEVDEFIDTLKKRLLERLSGGYLESYHQEFKDDMRDYCLGKLKYIPRYRSLIVEIRDVLMETFPNSHGDAQRNRAIDQIYEQISTPESWSPGTRGRNEGVG